MKDKEISQQIHRCSRCQKEVRYENLFMTRHGEDYVRRLALAQLGTVVVDELKVQYKTLEDNNLRITSLYCSECCKITEAELETEDNER